jgi:site-specific DNA-methyltransferase (adenine-specific)
MITIDQLQNRIICADCLDILRALPDKCVDLVLTDPPYGMLFQSNRRQEKYDKIENDNNLDWLDTWCEQINRIKKDNAHIYIFCSWHHVDIFKQAIEKHFPVKNILIWQKNNTGMGDLFNDYAPEYEMILYCNPSNKKLNGGRDSNILRYKRTQNELHPTQKPVDLFAYLIQKSTNENDLVLDCFSGSGTTAVACHNLKRRFICIEKDPEYAKASQERLEQAQRQQTLF